MMKTGLVVAALLWSMGSASTATADGLAGRWDVSGRIASFAFRVACDFQQAGEVLSGVCIDQSTSDARVKSGRRHILSQGKVDGDQVSWSYPSSFLFSHFSADYAGVRRGDHITGQITAQGRTGPFTADRAGALNGRPAPRAPEPQGRLRQVRTIRSLRSASVTRVAWAPQR